MITSLAMAPCPMGGGDELATVPSLSSRLAWAYSVVVDCRVTKNSQRGKVTVHKHFPSFCLHNVAGVILAKAISCLRLESLWGGGLPTGQELRQWFCM